MAAETQSLARTAERLGVGLRNLYELERQGKLPFPVLTIGRRKVVPVVPFERWLSGEQVDA